jgi:ribonuclease BN (tRNA processing enzyme)
VAVSEVTFIGTSDAFGAGGRRQSAVLMRASSGTLLIDCGATTCGGLQEIGAERDEIDAILVSHFHGDHFGGIPHILLAAIYEDHRTRPLVIAGPPEIEARVHALAKAMGHDLSQQEWPFKLKFEEVPPGRAYSIGPARITSFETRHQLEAHPHGYDVRCGEHRVVYSGDTGWFDELPRLSAGADLFICECTYHSRNLDFHLNYELLRERQREFDCGRMMLTHLGAEMAGRRDIEAFETADDGMVVKL